MLDRCLTVMFKCQQCSATCHHHVMYMMVQIMVQTDICQAYQKVSNSVCFRDLIIAPSLPPLQRGTHTLTDTQTHADHDELSSSLLQSVWLSCLKFMTDQSSAPSNHQSLNVFVMTVEMWPCWPSLALFLTHTCTLTPQSLDAKCFLCAAGTLREKSVIGAISVSVPSNCEQSCFTFLFSDFDLQDFC